MTMVHVLGFFVLVVLLLVVAVDREAVTAKDAIQAVVVTNPALFEEDVVVVGGDSTPRTRLSC